MSRRLSTGIRGGRILWWGYLQPLKSWPKIFFTFPTKTTCQWLLMTPVHERYVIGDILCQATWSNKGKKFSPLFRTPNLLNGLQSYNGYKQSYVSNTWKMIRFEREITNGGEWRLIKLLIRHDAPHSVPVIYILYLLCIFKQIWFCVSCGVYIISWGLGFSHKFIRFTVRIVNQYLLRPEEREILRSGSLDLKRRGFFT